MSDMLDIFIFLGQTLTGVFSSFDNVYFGDNSVLDIFIGVFLLECTLWFIFKVLGHSSNERVVVVEHDYPVDDGYGADFPRDDYKGGAL